MSNLEHFDSKLEAILRRTTQLNREDIRREWDSKSVDGNADLDTRVDKLDEDDVFFMVYTASGQKAWLLEHGSGSKMDNENQNPDLASYKHSSFWNNEREGTEIRTRPRSPMYKDLDGIKHHGSGIEMPHGINVEESQWHFHKSYKAIEPLHVMKEIVMGDTAINRMMSDAIEDLIVSGIDRAVTGATL